MTQSLFARRAGLLAILAACVALLIFVPHLPTY